jgi:type II secretory pathway pseudopilin PulG
MRFERANDNREAFHQSESARGLAHSKSAFTLAEVLAALAFMAIVIPVAINGLRVANLAGQVGERKAVAARIAERVLNEYTVTGTTQTPAQSGTVQEGGSQYRWSIRTEPWNQDTMRLVTALVVYGVQGQDYDLRVSTLMGNSTR